MNEIPLLSKPKRTGVKVADDINVSPADVIPERVERYYEISSKSVNNDSVEHLASFIKFLPEASKYKYYKQLRDIDIPSVRDRLAWNNEGISTHIKVRMLKDGMINDSEMGDTYEALRASGLSMEQALRVMGHTVQ